MNSYAALLAAAVSTMRAKQSSPGGKPKSEPKTARHFVNGKLVEVPLLRGYNPGAEKAQRSKRYEPNGARECARRKR